MLFWSCVGTSFSGICFFINFAEMKEYVFDIGDLQRSIPMFKGRVGAFWGKRLIKWLSMEKVNKLYANHLCLRGCSFTKAVLADPLIDISYRLHNQRMLDRLPEGAFVTVSNHPIGSLDGMILIDIFAACRTDFKVMVNGILSNIEAMGDNFISVMPDSKKQGANPANAQGLREAYKHIREGHPMGFFPSGAISCYNKEKRKVLDNPWIPNIVRMIRKLNIPVFPVYFDFYNSSFFYWLGTISWQIRTLRVPGELFNKKGKVVDVYLGNPISPQQISHYQDDKELASFLYECTYTAKPGNR